MIFSGLVGESFDSDEYCRRGGENLLEFGVEDIVANGLLEAKVGEG